ncbi:hypothetical protein [Mucilaginibacter sp. KACC 22063]|uniref:hypothetical protein n=1 Tax=Mucilaginibacter sp. KACC 22063 TaxID=3025666 RepID=UPI0023668BFF|nr:hypothetical protein [Mucilaginibacter sp. KACC 22063]WDF55609.1 hypothetical protein PQ461_00870 [Mucilaginibacter sp. KACC 22063]
MNKNLLLLLTGLFIYSGCNSENNMASAPTPIIIKKKADYNTNQPYYQLDFKAAFCRFEVAVNDVTVFNMSIAGQTSSFIPINAAISQSGKQAIVVKVYPLNGEKALHRSAEFSYNIKVFDALKQLEFKEQLSGEYAIPKIDPAKKIPFLTQSAFFVANVPYNIISYQDGADLRRITNLKDKLQGAYQQLARIIANKEMGKLQKLIANREHVVGVTMYLNKEETEARIKGLTRDLGAGFKLLPIPSDAIIKISGNGKLASLVKPNGDAAITLINTQTEEEMNLEFSFYIPKGKTELEII